MKTLLMLHRLLSHKLLVIGACILLISVGTSTIYARSRNHMRKASTQTTTLAISSTPAPSATISAESLLQGQWEYMPGMMKDSNGFVINPTKLAIVEQDASSSQPNPPINLAGTYLDKVIGDFSITTTLDLDGSKNATIQLYGKAPIIADEFRVERESVKMTVEKGKLTVELWNGKGQEPAITESFPFTPQDKIIVTMTRKSRNLLFAINDTQLGSISESGVFKSGQVWFGFDAEDAHWLLTDLSAQKLNGGDFTIIDASKLQISEHNPQGMQLLATIKHPGFIVGSAMALGPVMADADYAKVALDKNTFGGMTPENLMKMTNLQPQKGVFTFDQADALVHIAKQNGLTIHGHTLVFGEANPPWFNQLPVKTSADKQQIETIMKDHINTVMKHFGKDINSWDVVNEPLADYDEFNIDSGNILRDHKWKQAMGEDYIIKALETAHTANPDATLFINEYGLEADGERWDAFMDLMQKLKPQLATRDIPTDKIGVGFQAHVYEAADQIDAATLRKHLQQLAKLGFKAQISEMDVYNDDGDSVQTQQYGSIFQACLLEKNCVAWRTWILSDRYDLFKDNNQIEYGQDGLYSTTMLPRPGLTAIQQVLSK